MIKINVKEEKGIIKEVTLKGHALYETLGKDIVCAAVSSIVITTVNGILSIDEDIIKVDEKGFVITVLKDDKIVNKLLINMVNLLKELSEEYPDNIKFL